MLCTAKTNMTFFLQLKKNYALVSQALQQQFKLFFKTNSIIIKKKKTIISGTNF